MYYIFGIRRRLCIATLHRDTDRDTETDTHLRSTNPCTPLPCSPRTNQKHRSASQPIKTKRSTCKVSCLKAKSIKQQSITKLYSSTPSSVLITHLLPNFFTITKLINTTQWSLSQTPKFPFKHVPIPSPQSWHPKTSLPTPLTPESHPS